MILYPLYYRQHGIRRPIQLAAPPLSKLEVLTLPNDSLLHFVSEDESQYGIPQDDHILRHTTRMIYVDHLKELGDRKGPPRPTRLPINAMVREYHRKYRKTRPMPSLESGLRNPQTVIVENYALLPHLYRYSTSFFRNYYKWWNIQATVWKQVGAIAAQTSRQQYLECRLPTILPTLNQLTRGESTFNRSMVQTFASHESLFILELWKWLGEHRKDSVLANAPISAMAQMNLIWLEGDRWLMINLGDLDKWRKPTKDEIAAGADPHAGVVPAKQLQRRFLRMLMFLHEVRSAPDGQPKALTESVGVEKSPGTEPAEVPVAGDTQATTPEPIPEKAEVVERPVRIKVPHPTEEGKEMRVTVGPQLNVDNLPIDYLEETDETIARIDAIIEKDLKALDAIHEQLMSAEAEEVEDVEGSEPPTVRQPAVLKYTPRSITLEQGVMSKADALADAGLLSGAEYRRFTALAQAYKRLPDPYGEADTLEQSMVINPADLKLPTQAQIPDIKTVLDKSMLKSTLFDFDSRYLTKVMHKDLSKLVMNVQKAGVAVTGYEVSFEDDALNHFTTHTLSLTPVQGKPSTIRFRIPQVSEDGSFVVNGVRQRLRKQRGNLPIRKVTPAKVALTSYYSKVFVVRSDRKVNDYPHWLTNQVAALGMDLADSLVTQLMVANVFDNNNRTPRPYSIMAQRFRSFRYTSPTVSQEAADGGAEGMVIDFFFDFKGRKAHFGADRVSEAEKAGMVMIGEWSNVRSKVKPSVVVDTAGTLYLVKGDDLEVLGTFETLLGLERAKAPMEMVEIKVVNKYVPAGIFLAYHLGLTQLLEILQVTPRRVPTGERVHLGEDEYAMVFEDETLVLAKDDVTASLIMGGFAAMSNITRNYPSHQFDRKDIYFNVLDQYGLGVRYLREMDLLVELFIDPITEEILVSMEEPTDFIGLIFKSVELLETDWSPDETDLNYMRIKGYERFAGGVYSELVKAIRVQRSKGSRSAKIELAPYVVEQSLLRDGAVKLVEESNPVHNLREKEEVTFGGTGGRSDRSMVADTRVFHESDVGSISESTKDSAAVAVNTFLTADPHLVDVRGVTKRYKKGESGAASLLSTPALLAPSADRDD